MTKTTSGEKILIIANAILSDDPGVSGGETRFIEIAKQWQKAGAEIHLLGSRGANKLCEKFGLKVNHHLLQPTSKSGRLAFIPRIYESLFKLPNSIFSNVFDIVYSTNEMVFDVLPAWRIKVKRPRTKWATVVHWLPPFPPWKRRKTTVLNSILFYLNERFSLFLANIFANVLLPVSDSTLDQLRDVGWINMSKVVSVDCGVDYDLIRSIAKDSKKFKYDAIFMKRLQAVKGIFDLIEVWKRITNNNPKAKLAIVGEGIDSDKARKMVEDLGLTKNVEFKGVVTDPGIKFKLISDSRVFILPTYEENWAIVIGESLTCGTPVITYDLPELRRVWQNKIRYVPVGNVEVLSKKVQEVLDTQNLGQYSEKTIGWMKRYSWEKIAQREIQVILGK